MGSGLRSKKELRTEAAKSSSTQQVCKEFGKRRQGERGVASVGATRLRTSRTFFEKADGCAEEEEEEGDLVNQIQNGCKQNKGTHVGNDIYGQNRTNFFVEVGCGQATILVLLHVQ